MKLSERMLRHIRSVESKSKWWKLKWKSEASGLKGQMQKMREGHDRALALANLKPYEALGFASAYIFSKYEAGVMPDKIDHADLIEQWKRSQKFAGQDKVSLPGLSCNCLMERHIDGKCTKCGKRLELP